MLTATEVTMEEAAARPSHRVRTVLGATMTLALMFTGVSAANAAAHPVVAVKVKAGKPVSVKTLLKQLPTKAEHVKGYKRTLFVHWIKTSGQTCNTRQRVLIRDASVKPKKGKSCRLTGGKWTSTYDNVKVKRYGTLDIDHVVALKEAWDSGAWQWNASTRKAYANDLGYSGTLKAVTAHANRSKGDRDPADWLPRKADRCQYIKSYVGVKWRWHLSVDSHEKAAITKAIKSSCGTKVTMKAPKKATVKVLKTASTPAKKATPKKSTPKKNPVTAPFKNCTAARAAGAAPVHRGDPGYGSHLDRDGDGIGCE
ncbi:MAG: excalibur calcium-binding domain-containing protein [Cellulomonadaceae bacterium]|jgi:hypothetical protein|nr:excalibur calcium-binding domain-containing protein [Cellulomonadaceae bacterium]